MQVLVVIQHIIRERELQFNNQPGHQKGEYERRNYDGVMTSLKASESGLKRFVEFVREGKAQTGKPMVYKTRRGGYHCFPHRGSYIKPTVRLIHKDYDIEVQDRDFLALEQMSYRYDNKTNQQVKKIMACTPEVCHKHFSITRLGDDAEIKRLNDALVEDCGEALAALDQAIKQEWDRVGAALDQILDEHRVKKGPKERKILQEKLSEMISKTKGLIECDPASIHAVFKLGWEEIELLMKYTKRNRHEVDLAELEDIVEAQALAKVKNVMKS